MRISAPSGSGTVKSPYYRESALQRPSVSGRQGGQLTVQGQNLPSRQQDNFTQLDVQQHAVEVLLASAPRAKTHRERW